MKCASGVSTWKPPRYALIAALATCALAACNVQNGDHLQYRWDDQRILCSTPFDDYLHPINWDSLGGQLADARADNSVVIMHAHDPGASVSIETVDQLLSLVDRYGLEYVTFDELAPSSRARPAVAIAFDDHTVQDWYDHRDVLQRHNARVTFFVTFPTRITKQELEMLTQLASEGHDIEAHSVEHLSAPDFVAERGVSAYVAEEALPSISDLRALGFASTSYAYPYGEDVTEVNDILLSSGVDRIRVGLSECPY